MLCSRFSFRAERPFKADIYILADCGQDFQKRKQMGDWMMILFHKLRKFYKHLRIFGDHFSPSVLEHSIFLTLIFFFFFFNAWWGLDNMKVKVCRGLHVRRIYHALGAVLCLANSSFFKTSL